MPAAHLAAWTLACTAVLSLPSFAATGYTCQVLPDPGQRNDSRPSAINKAGDIAGHGRAIDGTRDYELSVVWKADGTTSLLPDLSSKGVASTWVRDLDDSGNAVGKARGAHRDQPAVLWRNGKIESLPVMAPLAKEEANAINARGDIVGTTTANSPTKNAVLWRNGQVIELEHSTFSSANDVNDAGIIVGVTEHTVSEGGWLAVYWDNGPGITRLGCVKPNGFDEERAVAINNDGLIVGVCQANGVNHAAAWDLGGTREQMRLVDDGESVATDVNASGAIVGQSGQDAVIWTDLTQAPLKLAAAVTGKGCVDERGKPYRLKVAEAINDSGVIAALGTRKVDGTVYYRSFRLVPQAAGR